MNLDYFDLINEKCSLLDPFLLSFLGAIATCLASSCAGANFIAVVM